jgi:hypothetical protein
MNEIFKIDNLIFLLGLKRKDQRISGFIANTLMKPIITIVKDEDSDDEFIEFKDNGFGLHFMDDILVAIHFSSKNGKPNYLDYKNNLPEKLKFGDERKSVLEHLGKPIAEGGGEDDFFGFIPYWVKYKMTDYYLHIEFLDDLVNVITIMNYE